MDCGAGVGNELDWASALYELADDAQSPQPAIETVLGILYALYNYAWTASGTGTTFADDLDDLLDPSQQDYFDVAGEGNPSGLYTKWTNVAASYLLDD